MRLFRTGTLSVLGGTFFAVEQAWLRDLTCLLGVVVILFGVGLLNVNFRKESSK